MISWSSARCGMSAGSDSAIATATAPRRPAQNRTWSHDCRHRLHKPRAGHQARHTAEEPIDHDGATDEDANDRPGDRAERIEEAHRRDGEPDEQEDDGRQQVGEELPDRVDGVGTGRRQCPARTHVPEHDRGGDRGDHPGQVEDVGEHVAAVCEHDRDRQLDEVIVHATR